ncbi:MAG: hypothetical protein IPJ09_05660 [Saprospiraceae bacterium]|nr:hypothetical protein [Saprospiraceae bacterium]
MNKTIIILVLSTLCWSSYAQSSLSAMIGYDQNTQYYEAYSGIDLTVRYQIGQVEKIKYGLALQYDHFQLDVAGIYTSSTSLLSLGLFSEFLPFKLKKIEPYLSASLAPTYCTAKGEVDFIFFGSAAEKVSFLAGQFSAGIGSRFSMTEHVALQIDIRQVLNYSKKFDADGFYNYSCINLGVNFKL